MVTLQFYGVRGSHPVADASMAKYGGNTSCVVILKTNKQGVKVPVIIDAGSGLIPLGYSISKKIIANEYSRTFSVLFTHLHPDHTEGFNFFVPNFFAFCTMYLLGMQSLKRHVGLVLEEKMIPPIFPIEYQDLKSTRVDHILNDGQVFYINQDGKPVAKTANPLLKITVLRAFAPSHPQQGALYFRVVDPDDNTSIACIWDIESHIGGDVRVGNFAQDADVMIHDTQYSDEEYVGKSNPVQGFGHSTYTMAMENAEKAGVKYLIPFHYNPRHNDAFLDNMDKKIRANNLPFEFIMSYEGLSLSFENHRLVKTDNVKQGFSL
ncbi:MBL fold metallo-hydrolase [Spirochaetia bacterium]|nr:MBL fold metallo-hydrolase [Spirochaetia bacterium]